MYGYNCKTQSEAKHFAFKLLTPILPQKQGAKCDKSLAFVEQAFSSMKTVALEIRPVYHKRDDRIRSHAFLCMLAYYVYWHMKERLAPLFAEDGQGRNREWTMENVLENLAGIRKERMRVSGTEFEQVSLPNKRQQRILDLLNIRL